ncbi:rhombosortase [Vibrio sp. WXL210]|uniref:rhombosortase n=1 Tax=Vibrio sp. WXL210 TaxID=3450709 RepID=UPI003EC8924B
MRHSLKPYLVVMIVSVIALALQFDSTQVYVSWHRQYILDGQWWRIITGHFSHTNTYHLFINLATFWVMAFIFQPAPRQLTWLLLALSGCIGLTNFAGDVEIYLGLSGVLHGVFAFYALDEALNGRRSSWLLVIGISAKVAWEQLVGPSAETASLINANVAIDAHFVGTVLGLLFAGVFYRCCLRHVTW